MTKETQATTHRGPRPIWFNVLLFLDVFALGGLAVWRFVLTFLENAQTGFITPSGEIFHVLDALSPYWLGYTAASILLLFFSAGGYLWLRTRSRIVSVVPIHIPFILLSWLVIARGR